MDGTPQQPQVQWVDDVIDAFGRARALLLAARDLVSRPGAWGRDGLAFDAAGRPAAPASREASSFCVAGALLRAAVDTGIDDPVAWLVEDGAPGSSPAPQPSVPVAVCASLLCAVFSWRLHGTPIDPRASSERAAATADAIATLADENRQLRASATAPRLLGAVALINDLPATSLPVLQRDLAVAAILARVATSAFADPTSALRLREYLAAHAGVSNSSEPAPRAGAPLRGCTQPALVRLQHQCPPTGAGWSDDDVERANSWPSSLGVSRCPRARGATSAPPRVLRAPLRRSRVTR